MYTYLLLFWTRYVFRSAERSGLGTLTKVSFNLSCSVDGVCFALWCTTRFRFIDREGWTEHDGKRLLFIW